MQLQLQFKDERKEIEGFLKELSTRLREIDDEVKKISGISDKRFENIQTTSSKLSDVAGEIENDISEEQNIENLKDSVKSHVIMIRHHMDSFLTEENTQQNYSVEVVQQLAKELLNVKREADELREQLEKKRLQATHDTLTRIPNRLAYDEWIEQEHDRFTKYDTPFVLMVWDVDFFKRVNDEFGHQAGDKVLRIIAQMITENIRDADFVARYGGEEFVVVLPGTLQDAAMKVANNIRLAIEACAFHFRDKPVKVTASAGIAEIQENESVQMLFERADKALYKAKDSGRNICILG
jgi:diguanylate cyclase